MCGAGLASAAMVDEKEEAEEGGYQSKNKSIAIDTMTPG